METFYIGPQPLLSKRRFAPVFLTQFFGAFNDNVYKNALIILISYRLMVHDKASQELLVTIAFGLFSLPFFLFSYLAGSLADKYDKASLIRCLKLAELGIVLLASYALFIKNIPLLLLVLFLLGAQSAFFGSVKYAILPQQLAKRELMLGNGWINASTFVAILMGTLIGGLFILPDNGIIFISLIVISIAVMGLISSYYIIPTRANAPDLNINYNPITASYQLLHSAYQHKKVFCAMLGLSWFWFLGASFMSQFPNYVQFVLGAGAPVVTVLLLIFIVGIASGSMLCHHLVREEITAKLTPFAGLLCSLFIFDLCRVSNNLSLTNTGLLSILGFFSNFSAWHISVDLFFIALCGGLYMIPLFAIMQHDTPKEQRARIIGANNILNAFFMVSSAIFCSVLLSLSFKLTSIFSLVAWLNIGFAFCLLRLIPYGTVQSWVRILAKLIYKTRVQGLSQINDAGERVLFIANHTSFLDAVLVAAHLPNKPLFVINRGIGSSWWFRPVNKLINGFLLDPSKPMAIKTIIKLIKQGRHCVIFPEGRITLTGALMKIYEGPGLIADRTQATIVPVRIKNAEYSPFSRMRGKLKRRLFPKIFLNFQAPVCVHLSPEVKGRKRRQLMTDIIYDLMQNMMFKSSNLNQDLFTALLEARSTHGAKRIVISDTSEASLSYHDLIKQALVLGRKLKRQTKNQEKIGLLLPSMGQSIVAFFALLAYGRIPVLLDGERSQVYLREACHISGVKQVYTSKTYVERFNLTRQIALLTEREINVYYLEDIQQKIALLDTLRGALKAHFYDTSTYHIFKAITDSDKKTQQLALSAKKPAVILMTETKTGLKGVALSHKNIQAHRYQLTTAIDFNQHDLVFNALPMHHALGLITASLVPILAGVKIFCYPKATHYRVIPEMFYDNNATIMFSTDSLLAKYAACAHPYDFYSARYIFAIAENLQADTKHTWMDKFGHRVLTGYSMSEASPILAMNTPMRHRSDTLGRFVIGLKHRIVDGELHIKGPNLMLGYLDSEAPGEIKRLRRDWFATGDQVLVDDDGHVRIIPE